MFAQPLAWHAASPGLLFEAVRDAYPQDPEAQEQVEASLQVSASSPANLSLNRGKQRFIYKDSTGKRLLIANDMSLSVNSLRPYEGWPDLRERLRDALARLDSVTKLAPVAQINLRYINQIRLPLGPFDTDDYFTTTIRTAASGRANFRAFMHRTESVLPELQTIAVCTFASLAATESATPILLDLDFQRIALDLRDIDQILAVADQLKELENDEFESWLTNKTREFFK